MSVRVLRRNAVLRNDRVTLSTPRFAALYPSAAENSMFSISDLAVYGVATLLPQSTALIDCLNRLPQWAAESSAFRRPD